MWFVFLLPSTRFWICAPRSFPSVAVFSLHAGSDPPFLYGMMMFYFLYLLFGAGRDGLSGGLVDCCCYE
jgi:hypothetical protein